MSADDRPDHERVGSGYDAGAVGYELAGRDPKPMTMRERMARALFNRNVGANLIAWSHETRDYWLGSADAVLVAMREEPSPAILTAMRDTVPVDGYEWAYLDHEAVAHWQAMIDAIKTEGP